MREQVFVNEVMRSLRARGLWCHKIADTPVSYVKANLRFTPTRALDIIYCHSGGMFGAVECKQFKSYKAFSPRFMRPAQIEALDALTKQGAKTWVFLNIRIARTENRLIAFPWEKLSLIWSQKKTIRAKMLKDLPHVTGRTGQFDLGFLGGNVNDLCASSKSN